MKKTLIALAALTAVSTASADRIGIFGGTQAGISYEQPTSALSSVRYGLTGLGLFSGAIAVSGEVAYLNALPDAGAGAAFNPYYGFGVNLGIGLARGAGGAVIYPHALLGASFPVTPDLNVYAEGNAGPAIALGAGGGNVAGGIGFGYGARIGVNYQLR